MLGILAEIFIFIGEKRKTHPNMKKTTFLLLTLLMLASCVEEFKIPKKVMDEYESEIVIQGRILAGEESVVYVSYTSQFNQEIAAPAIRDAEVYIVGNDGYRSSVAEYEPENNCYTVDTRSISRNVQYAVEVKLDGETYQSDFLSIMDSPDIDEITYKENGDTIHNGISIHVTTFADDEDSRHYMWSYEEDWEFHAEIDITRTPHEVPIYNENWYPLESPNVNPYYYCWMSSVSRNVHIYSTSELNENSVKNVKLIDIPIDDIRISYIYSILVKQWSLSDDAYHYYKTLKKYTEESGGLFTPMPTEIHGNVSCISNPKKKARGYVLASNVKNKRIFVYSSDFKEIIPQYENCYMEIPGQTPNWEFSWLQRIDAFGHVVLSKSGKIDVDSRLYSSECVDCRETKGSTKKRPAFWPNNHE